MNSKEIPPLSDMEIRQLLAKAMAYDNRSLPGQATILAWAEAAEAAHWTYPEALDAIRAHYAESTEFVMPGHLTRLIRAARRADAEKFKALPGPPPASDAHRAVQMAKIRGLVGNFAAMPADTGVMGTAEAARKRAADQDTALARLDELLGRGGAP